MYVLHERFDHMLLLIPTQIYSKYAEVSDELIKEKEAKELVQNQLNYLIQVLLLLLCSCTRYLILGIVRERKLSQYVDCHSVCDSVSDLVIQLRIISFQ